MENEKVLIKPGGFNRKIPVRENVLLAILPPYLTLARTMARASLRKHRFDWGGLWNVPEKRGGFSIAGPCIGAPNAATMLESLIAFGAKRIIAVGCCGSLRKDVKLGDLLVVTGAMSEEGVSQHYMPEKFPPRADGELIEALKNAATGKEWEFKEGDVWTTSAPYRETHQKVKDYGERGLAAVEMELSAIFTVAAFRGVQAGSIQAVSDELWTLEWKPGFFKKDFLSATRRVLKVAIEALKNLK